jgi:DNA-binding MarR family transcriptional regulator
MPMEPSRDLAHLLSHAERRLASRLAASLEGENCSVEEWRVLKFLADGNGHPMSEIADFAMLPAPTLTKLTDRMVSEGLVFRRADERDRRRVLAYLSERGLRLQERVSRLVGAIEADLLGALGDEGELARWLTRLGKILDAQATAVGSRG